MATRSVMGKAFGLIWLGTLGLAGVALAQPKPNELAHGWIPTPAFTSPTVHQKFTPSPSLTVSLNAKIPTMNPGGYTVPGPFDFVAYAKASPYTEKWHIHVLKQGPGGTEMLLQKFEGPVTGNTFSLVLNANWLGKHGSGKYAARAFLSQVTPKGSDDGMATAVGFEILVPQASAKLPEQKVGPLNAKPVPLGTANASSAGAPRAGESSTRSSLPSSALAPLQPPPAK